MRRLGLCGASMLLIGLAGCASGLPRSQQTNDAGLPGTREMAEGPGLFSGDHYSRSNGGGTLIYSDENPGTAVLGSSAAERNNRDAARASSGGPRATATAPDDRNRDYEDFRAFQAYRRFQRLPADAPRKQDFREWREWRAYQRWQRRQP